MPGTIQNFATGYLGFCAVKFAGYTLAARTICIYYEVRKASLLIGATRTLIGMVVGGSYYFAASSMAYRATGGAGLVVLYLVGLIVLRLVEWWMLIGLFFDRRVEHPVLGWKVAAGGTVWSFFLDLPATLGFCITGGLMIC